MMYTRATLLAAAVAVITGLTACTEDMRTFEPSPDSVPIDSIIALTASRTGAVHADTAIADTISAHIPLQADVRDVDFTTTKGWFAETSHATELKIRASLANPNDGFLTASVVLRFDTLATAAVVDTATIRATVSDFTAVLRIPLIR